MTKYVCVCTVANVARMPPVVSAEAADGSKESLLGCLGGKLIVSCACDRGSGDYPEIRCVVTIPVMLATNCPRLGQYKHARYSVSGAPDHSQSESHEY